MQMPIVPLTTEEGLRRAATLGWREAWVGGERGDAARVLLHAPAVAAVMADILAVLLLPERKLGRHLHELIVLRMAHAAGVEPVWLRDLCASVGFKLDDARVSAATAETLNADGGMAPAERALLSGVDDVLRHGRIGDSTWAAWHATQPSVEATVEMVVALGAWRMASEVALSLDLRMGKSSPAPLKSKPRRSATVHDGSKSSADRLNPLTQQQAEQVCVEQGMNPALSRSVIWTRLLRHPALAAPLSRQLYHLLLKGQLSPRLRELVIMRIGWITGAAHEWTRHYVHSMKAGISPAEVVALRDWKEGGFDERERAALAATDEIVATGCVTDATWAACGACLEPPLLVELLAVIGNWHMFSYFMRSLGIPPEPGTAHWPPDGRGPFD